MMTVSIQKVAAQATSIEEHFLDADCLPGVAKIRNRERDRIYRQQRNWGRSRESLLPETRLDKKLISASAEILQSPGRIQEAQFQHVVICQLGLPRSQVAGLHYERRCGGATIMIRAGSVWNGREFIQQPVPYGSLPRLIMTWINTFAVRNKTREIDLGKSMADFLKKLNKSSTGGDNGTIQSLKKQMSALVACSLTLGLTTEQRAITFDGTPIQQFSVWREQDDTAKWSWPQSLTLSADYFRTLLDAPVPVDFRAMRALQTSPLAMDLYAFLAYRYFTLSNASVRKSVFLNWTNLRGQFGASQRSVDPNKDFKKSFIPALKKVELVYPGAQFALKKTGILLLPSPTPISNC